MSKLETLDALRALGGTASKLEIYNCLMKRGLDVMPESVNISCMRLEQDKAIKYNKRTNQFTITGKKPVANVVELEANGTVKRTDGFCV